MKPRISVLNIDRYVRRLSCHKNLPIRDCSDVYLTFLFFMTLFIIISRDALEVINYGPSEDRPIFANSGCRPFIHRIPFVIKKHKARDAEL